MKIKHILPILCLAVFLGCGDTTTEVEVVELPDSHSSTIRVPANAPNVQLAINMADDLDTILVFDGVYTGTGNRDIDLAGKSVILKSVNGPVSTIIDCGGSVEERHSGFIIDGGSNDAVIDGFTIKNGYTNSGGALWIRNSTPTIRYCIIVNNTGTTSGGAVWCKGAEPIFQSCTFVGNSSMAGGAFFLNGTALPTITGSIVAFSGEGGGIFSNETSSQPSVMCTDVFSNSDGNWAGNVIDQSRLNGNIEADPQFCNEDAGDFRLQPTSPCARDNNGCIVNMGALGIGCD